MLKFGSNLQKFELYEFELDGVDCISLHDIT